MFGNVWLEKPKDNYETSVRKLKQAVDDCDAVLIGAGSGLSTAAGYRYSGEVFDTYFADFKKRYRIRDMYSGGFYPFPSMEEYWAWWSRHIWLNRYVPIPNDTYARLLDAVREKDYFVLTTNVDHCFQRAGFDKQKLFYTQGDYGLLQSVSPRGASAGKTYDNQELIRPMLLSQGFQIGEDGALVIPEGAQIQMEVDPELIPRCPDDGGLMVPNLRADDTFVEDDGWRRAQARYHDFLRRHDGLKVLYLELGVGGNTPVIIKYPFWRYTDQNKNAVYACVNMGEALAPPQIIDRSILIDGDIRGVVEELARRGVTDGEGQL